MASGVFSLSDLQWSLSNANGSIVVPGSLPSQVHLDLQRAGIITEPLLGINDFTQRWIVTDNWTYTADVTPFLSTQNESADATLLVFYGIDTVANITLAEQPVAWVNNEFQQYVFNVTDILSTSDNNLSINLTLAFESPYLYGLNASGFAPDSQTFGDFEYPWARVWTRKIQSDFGWDWGPAFVPMGVHKPAYFITLSANSTTNGPDAFSPALISETSIDIYKEGFEVAMQEPANETAPWVMEVKLGVHSVLDASATLTLSIPELDLTSDALPLGSIPSLNDSVISTPSFVSANWTIDDSLPERWWPHNLGTPKLYNLSLTLNIGETPLTFNSTIGFRTIRLAQTRYPDEEVAARGITPGDQWHFEVNGAAFYASGTNIIPFDPFYARVTDDQVRWVIESAVQGGQNMLRVWGGGAYQPSTTNAAITPVYPPHATDTYSFYAFCDELGILAWSEFIFSDDLYPIDDWLLSSIKTEVQQNVRRVNKHPSVAQWAGGNEIEGIVTTVNQTVPNGNIALDEYVALFQDFLWAVAYGETKSVPYTDCSTTHGVLSIDPLIIRFNNATPGEIYGNGERYNYDASQAFNLSTFPVTRYHSMPSFYSWEQVLESPDDFSFNSTVVMSRDHHPPAGNLSFPNPNAPQGQAQMTQGVELWMPSPDTGDANGTFAAWAWSTQVFQAMTMDAQIAWYRRGAGLGENNLGSLVWQLNDIWQGVSWSSIEYDGRWKVLQYTMSRDYQPVVINAFWTPENETLQLLVTSDRLEDVSGTAQWTWYDWSGQVLSTSTANFTTPPLNNSVVFVGQGLDQLLPSGAEVDNAWLLMNVTAEANNGTVTHESYFTPASLANASFVDPQLQLIPSPDGNLTFTVSAQGGVAAWAWLEHPANTVGVFVDSASGVPSNAFFAVPGIDRQVTFLMNEALSKNTSPALEGFVIRSMWNNTYI
ncbi:glycoside hydrolase family 2 protein [Peniophora sp. CONT]|nr:glycoside hydrolase family 2 protein [Peniophora sp. CONT]